MSRSGGRNGSGRCLLCILLSLAAPAASSASVNVIVTLTEDNVTNGNCTLREALLATIQEANVDQCLGDIGPDTIILEAVGSYELDDGDIAMTGRVLTLRGDLDHPRSSYVVDLGDAQRLLWIVSASDLTLENLELTRGFGGLSNNSDSQGGALDVRNSNLTARNVRISDSQSINGGGLGFRTEVPASLDLESVEFANNSANALDPSSQRSGGGLRLLANTTTAVRMVDVQFLGNSIVATEPERGGFGGGFYFEATAGTSFELRHLVFDGNVIDTTEVAVGGAMWGYYGATGGVLFEDAEFLDNDFIGAATIIGGSAFDISVAGAASATFRRLELRGNGPGDAVQQGLIRAQEPTAIVVSDVLAVDGGGDGLYLDAQCSTCSMVAGNLTVARNARTGLTLGQNGGSSLRIENSILFGNAIVTGTDLNVAFGTVDVSSENFVGVDPQFVAPLSGDYRLGPLSTAVDAGDQGFASVGPWDAAHGERVLGTDVDLGALERGAVFSDDFEYGDAFAWSERMP